MSDAIIIRPAREADRPALHEICIATAEVGGDARLVENAPELLPLIFAEPYLTFAPQCAFVAEDAGGVCGYVVGVPDSRAFDAWVASDWFPSRRQGVPDPGDDTGHWRKSDWLRHWLHHPTPTPPHLIDRWPAHGHIDLLPRAQGHGLGKSLLNCLFASLAAEGACGLHLGVDPRNHRALGFYEKLGFRPAPDAVGLGAVYVVRDLRPV